MIDYLLASYRSLLADLAERWLAAGASTFVVMGEQGCLAGWPDTAVAVQPGVQTAPIVVDGRTIGHLGFSGAGSPAQLAADAAMLARLAQLEQDLDQVTAELINTQDQLLAMYDLAQSTRKPLELPELLQLLARETHRLTAASEVVIAVRLPGGQLMAAACQGGALLETAVIDLLALAQAVRSHVTLKKEDIRQLLNEDFDQMLVIPVSPRADMVGMLVLADTPSGFATPTIKLARAIATHASAVIETSLLYQENIQQARLQLEMDLARRVQTGLLPQQQVAVAGVDVFATTRPALQVGGDFFDLLKMPERPFLFTVGDVSGKGLSAAMLMTMTRTIIRSAKRNLPAATPRAILDQANADLYNDFTEVGMFATVFVGSYEPQTRRLTYANAGHSPVIFCPAQGAATLLMADGTAVGVLPDNLAEDHQLQLQVGDVLVVATDGFSEARSEGGTLFGYDRLLAMVSELRQRSAAEMGEALITAVQSFAGDHPQDDDETIIVIKGVPS